MELFHDRVFYVSTKCSQDQRALCCDTAFCVMIELVKARSFYVTTEYLCVVTEFVLGQGRDRIFYFTTEDGQVRGFMLRQGILGCDIVGQAEKIFYRDRVFLCRGRVCQGKEELCCNKVFLCCDKV